MKNSQRLLLKVFCSVAIRLLLFLLVFSRKNVVLQFVKRPKDALCNRNFLKSVKGSRGQGEAIYQKINTFSSTIP